MPETPAIHPLIATRWSPRNYTLREIEPSTVRTLFEASHWAASCFNEQPWRFVVATQADPAQFARMLSLLVPKNQEWAKDAWILGFTTGKRTFSSKPVPNRFGLHDAGAALATLALEANALGLQAHGMGGFDAERARSEFNVPDDFEIGAAFTVGTTQTPPPEGRTRKPLEEIVFSDDWGKPAPFLAS
jgi:nitroreductase